MKMIIYLRLLLFSMALFFVVACKQNSQNSMQSNLEEKQMRDSLLQLPLVFPKSKVGLAQEAQSEVENWMLYTAMQAEIDRMQSYTLDDVIANSATILRASDTLKKTIPKIFRVLPVQSRVKVLHTKANVLNQLSQKQPIDLLKIKEVAEEIPVDFYNLNIQLNEVYIKLPELESLP